MKRRISPIETGNDSHSRCLRFASEGEGGNDKWKTGSGGEGEGVTSGFKIRKTA